jgi:serine/threonine protein kinase
MLRQPYVGPEVDMFGLGALLYVMLTARFPFGSNGDRNSSTQSKAGRCWASNDRIGPQVAKLLDALLDASASARWSAMRVLRYLDAMRSNGMLDGGDEVRQVQSARARSVVRGVTRDQRVVVVKE